MPTGLFSSTVRLMGSGINIGGILSFTLTSNALNAMRAKPCPPGPPNILLPSVTPTMMVNGFSSGFIRSTPSGGVRNVGSKSKTERVVSVPPNMNKGISGNIPGGPNKGSGIILLRSCKFTPAPFPLKCSSPKTIPSKSNR